MLFLNAIPETYTQAEAYTQAEVRRNLVSDLGLMTPYFPQMREMIHGENEYDADLLKLEGTIMIFWDFDGLWKRYTRDCQLHEVGKVQGMVMKKENTIVSKWPLRLKKNATQAEFCRLQASGHTGCERYVEWRRAA